MKTYCINYDFQQFVKSQTPNHELPESKCKLAVWVRRFLRDEETHENYSPSQIKEWQQGEGACLF